MNNRAVVLSTFMAVIAIFFVQSYVSSIEEQTKVKFGTEVLVVVAKKDIMEMGTIDETMLELKRIPKRFLEPAAIFYQVTGQDDAVTRDMKNLAGTVAIVPIRSGEQMTHNKISEPNMRTGLAPQVTPGKRAIAVAVTEVSGVAKLVKPGDRVDLIAILEMGAGRDNKVAKTLLQDVVVLAVGRNVTNNIPRVLEQDSFNKTPKFKSLTQFDGFVSVTVEVDPAQAQMLALASSMGSNVLYLSLRNNDDTEKTDMGGVGIADLMGADAARASRLPAQIRK